MDQQFMLMFWWFLLGFLLSIINGGFHVLPSIWGFCELYVWFHYYYYLSHFYSPLFAWISIRYINAILQMSSHWWVLAYLQFLLDTWWTVSRQKRALFSLTSLKNNLGWELEFNKLKDMVPLVCLLLQITPWQRVTISQ